MLKTKVQKIICFFIVSVLLFTAAYIINSTKYFSSESDTNFDWWSESLIYADMMYHKEYPNEDSTFTKSLGPSKLAELYGGEWQDYENHVRLAYENSDNRYNQSDFGSYTSNIVIQRFFFRLLDKILPFSNPLKIHLFHFINCLLLAISITVILCWIIKVLDSFGAGVFVLLSLALFSPNLIMYGKNLYWCAWTLFLPTVIMILLLESKHLKKAKHKIMWISIFAIIGIIIKCLFYFEFISVVLVSMMIPVIHYLLNLPSEQYSIKRRISYFIIVSSFAIIGFLLVLGIKLLLLNQYYGNLSEAISTLFDNLQNRVLGNTSAESIEIAKSSNASFVYVIRIMFGKPFMIIKSVFSITQLGLILIDIVSTTTLIILNKRLSILSQAEKSWMICCWISIIGPFSWFVLAKPHTYIHNHHCSITWFIIFDIMALSIVALLIKKAVKNMKDNANK